MTLRHDLLHGVMQFPIGIAEGDAAFQVNDHHAPDLPLPEW